MLDGTWRDNRLMPICYGRPCCKSVMLLAEGCDGCWVMGDGALGGQVIERKLDANAGGLSLSHLPLPRPGRGLLLRHIHPSSSSHSPDILGPSG